jgi:hypothetical protein
MAEQLRRPHPSWDELSPFLESDAPSLHALDGEPPVAIFIDPGAPRVGLRIPLGDEDFTQDAPLAEIEIRTGLINGARNLEVTTSNSTLFPIFFPFVLTLADRVQLERVAVGAAVAESLDKWRDLLRQAAMLSEDAQTGLMGELWFLDRLADTSPQAAIAAWTGPQREAHDFRIGDREFEVKTTRGERRIHVISNMTQLVPSPGHELYVLSLQFAASGAVGGQSLAESLQQVRDRFDRAGLAQEFDRRLRLGYGLLGSSWDFYRERLQLRSSPALIPVTPDFPSIRQEDILAIARPGMNRVTDIRYRLDMSGLGFEEGSPEFASLLPEAEEMA